MEGENEESRFDAHSATRSPRVPLEDVSPRPFGRKTALTPAEQILVGTHQQPTYKYPTPQSESMMTANPYLLANSDAATLSRSMTALGLSNTIPEEPTGVDLDSDTLLNARRVASKSAIDLVGLNEAEVFDANAPLSGDYGLGPLGMAGQSARTTMDNGFSFQVTMLPSRSLIVSNLSPMLNDESTQMLFQMSGDVQSVRTEYRLQGIVQITYYDIRAAIAAKEQLNNLLVADQCLNVQFVTTPGSVGTFTEGTLVVFNIDPKLDAQQVAMRFSVYGEVKRVHSIPEKENHRLVEFYDLRHANAAMEALNNAETPAPQSKPPGFASPGMKQKTMSLQQLAGGSLDSEQDEGEESRSWDESVKAVQQMEALTRSSNPSTPSQYLQSTSAGRMIKSVSFGSGLGDVKGVVADLGQDTPTGKLNGAVRLTPELAEGLRISDSASSLGSIVFPSQGTSAGSFTASPKMQPGMGSYGATGFTGGMHQRSLSNSTSVETGLDSYAHPGLSNPALDPSVAPFSPQQAAVGFQQGLGFGMGGTGMHPNQSYLSGRQSMDPTALLHASGNENLLQTIAAAQAAGFGLYDVLSRLPNANLATVSQLLAANRGGMGANPLVGDVNPAAVARLAALQNIQSTGFPSGGSSSPSYGLTPTTGSPGIQSGILKSRSSPALHAAPDREQRRFGGRLSRGNVDPLIEAERLAQQQRLYALDINKIRRGEDKRTTLMIKNIPNKYTQKMLLASMDETLKGSYDFFYLPIDFKNKCNVGYGFINMRDPADIVPLVERFHNKKWERFNSEKICCVAYGRIQGKQALINHFQNSSLMHEDKKHRPVLFVTDGPHKGDPEPFPIGSNIRPKITLKERDFRSRERSGHWA